MLVARHGFDVVAASELDSAKKHFASADCDVVVAVPELARDAAVLDDAPAVIAVVRTRDVALV